MCKRLKCIRSRVCQSRVGSQTPRRAIENSGLPVAVRENRTSGLARGTFATRRRGSRQTQNALDRHREMSKRTSALPVGKRVDWSLKRHTRCVRKTVRIYARDVTRTRM